MWLLLQKAVNHLVIFSDHLLVHYRGSHYLTSLVPQVTTSPRFYLSCGEKLAGSGLGDEASILPLWHPSPFPRRQWGPSLAPGWCPLQKSGRLPGWCPRPETWFWYERWGRSLVRWRLCDHQDQCLDSRKSWFTQHIVCTVVHVCAPHCIQYCKLQEMYKPFLTAKQIQLCWKSCTPYVLYILVLAVNSFWFQFTFYRVTCSYSCCLFLFALVSL